MKKLVVTDYNERRELSKLYDEPDENEYVVAFRQLINYICIDRITPTPTQLCPLKT